MKVFYCILVLFLQFNNLIALRCYTCSVSESDNDQRCITDPASVETGSAITDCDKAYCTSIRIEYLDPRDVVQSMVRSCNDNPTRNSVVEDGTYRVYYVACQTDLCNGGNGKRTSSSSTSNSGSEVVLLVPGTGGANSVHSTSVILVISCTIYFVLFE